DGDILFQSAYFENGDHYFTSLFLHNGSIYFTDSHFFGGNVDLSFSQISGGLYLNKMYLKNICLNCCQTSTEEILFASTEMRDSIVLLCYMKIGNGKKLFNEIYLQNSNLLLDNSYIGHGEINFSYAETINACLISFKHTVFEIEEINFSYSLIGARLEFSYANLGEATLNFSEATLETISLDSVSSTGTINLRARTCYALSLKNASIGKLLTISPSIVFSYLQLSSMVISGKIIISWKENNVSNAINNMYKAEVQNIAKHFFSKIKDEKLKELKFFYTQIFRVLKDNFNQINQYPDEDATYISYRRSLRAYNTHSKNIIKKISGFAEWLVLDLWGGYGTDPWRALIGIVIVWLGFAGAYYYIDSFSISSSSEDLTRLGRSLYHSGITLFTIGYGDLIPTGPIMRALSNIEGFFGVLLPSYFMIAFTRKMLR
ncbi:MAG: potassium channel family protein, partial [Brevinema sp.]